MMDYSQFNDLLPLQKSHCQAIAYLDEFCTAHGIDWCLARGSALGAARHNGPIPWDDDADIYMTAEGYDRFRRLFREEGDHTRFYLQELDCVGGMLPMPKFRINGTTFIEESFENADMHHGIYVDIYILHTCPPTPLARASTAVCAMYALLKRLSSRHYSRKPIVRPLMAFLRLFPRDFGLRTAYRQMYRWDDFQQPRLVDWEMFKGNPRWFFDQSLIFPVRRTAYNGYQFCVPHQLEKYLDIYYGNWRSIPSADQIRWAQHAKIWSTTEDFRTYAPNVHTFRDEKL